ncbi:hypothetical protein ASG43_18365 [Aureimonas sp. Leaf454]|nr:hypothetical protein ASG43_18365 [Aureimonas sp. Leaf454]
MIFVTIMSVHFGVTLMFVGPYAGVEVYAICMLLVPMLIFSKSELALLRAAYAIMISLICVSEYAASLYPPVLVLSEESKNIFYITNLISVAIVVTFLLYFYSRSSLKNYIDLQLERNKSENMLRDLLPQTVAEKMIRGEQIVAQSNGECTVLFADLIGFTRLSEKLSPIHLVELLNDIFTDIDVICDRYGIEKIKTIGDCYMAAAGALETQGQPTEMALLGLGIIDIVKDYAERTGYPLAVRVGINTGQVVSGVIGTKRRMFDIWGQTVNVAQMLESNCLPNRVLVSESMQWRLRHRFEFSDALLLEAKSGLTINGYFITGERAGLVNETAKP